MATSHRLDRINSIILRELSLLIANKVKDDRVLGSSIGVTEVKTTPDLSEATVYVSILGTDQSKEDVMAGLKSAGGFLRKELSRVLTTYQTPALRFVLDESHEHGNKIDGILNQLREEGQISDTLPEEDEAF